MKKVLIFGSTGSVGKNALDVIRKAKKDFRVLGLCAYRDIKTLYRQIKEFSPSYVCVRDEKAAMELKKELNRGVKLFKGEEGLREFSCISCDISLMAITGISCLKPLLLSLKYTQRVALANKESIVTAGSFVLRAAARSRTEIFPVDSEISALSQLLKINKAVVNKVYLTASGGPLLNHRKKELAKVGVKEVLSHPTWKMGKRITVDSATLVNKGFEAVEAHYFFNLSYKDIDIVIHKESAIHALVELGDHTLFACAYLPDMRMPIAFAFHYPKRPSFFKRIDFGKKLSFTFIPLPNKFFPLLKVILEAANREDNSLAILNACDEIAVGHFLKGKIEFTQIIKVMEYIFQHYPKSKIKSIEDVFFWDNWARIKTEEYLKK
ncbi:MAG: 1-deoxy-D-xylulose-5-phosphate reductoisomerase [Candidatus Omnitrophica bacterium]|nr:1-deoxy-D-xylulose-5-phosphate reductoisomerase [Candidatus Omnitrophota bacterium]